MKGKEKTTEGANAEFLEVLYGENQYLKNILHAAGKAKQRF